MSDVTISVPEIHCGNCKSSIEGAVRPLGGVHSADVDIDAKTVHVSFEPPATLEEITRAIEEQGYDVPAG